MNFVGNDNTIYCRGEIFKVQSLGEKVPEGSTLAYFWRYAYPNFLITQYRLITAL